MAHSLGWKVLGELASDGAGVTVGSADLAPDNSGAVGGGLANISGVGLCLRLVDVSDSFAKVEGGVFLVVDALELDERGLLVLVSETSSVTGEDSLSVKTAHGEELRFWSDLIRSRSKFNQSGFEIKIYK